VVIVKIYIVPVKHDEACLLSADSVSRWFTLYHIYEEHLMPDKYIIHVNEYW